MCKILVNSVGKTCCLNYDFFEKAKILFGDVLKWGGEGGGGKYVSGRGMSVVRPAGCLRE